MVSVLSNAAEHGRLDDLNALLVDANPADLQFKDQTGATPLVHAVKNGHVQIVKALLDKGADPNIQFNEGPLQQLTQNQEIIELLTSAQSKMISENTSTEPTYPPTGDNYPPANYPYYPTLNGPPPPIQEGAVFYPPQPPADGQHPHNPGPGNLPPPEIARLIPCRYFPACRYGSSCMFAHPQTPYFQGPMPPPAQYPAPYDPMNQNYPSNYYSMPPPSFQPPPPPNGPVPMTSVPSPPVGPPMSVPSPNEMPPPPPPPAPFSPNGAPPSMPYQPMMSPPAFPHSGPASSVPMSVPPLPPLYHQPPPPPPQSQSQPPYPVNPQATPFAVQPNGAYPPGPVPVPVPYPDVNNSAKSPPLNPQPENYGPPVRDPVQNRRGNLRRTSLGTRKPPCLFFPAGKCKNGDDCRFPHVLPDNSGPHQQFTGGRGGAPRPRPHVNNSNGIGTIEEKMSGMTLREGSRADAGPRPRYPPGYKNGASNGPANNKRPAFVKPQQQQRLPNAEDFPGLPGSTTPPAKAGLNGYFANGNSAVGPTAAQVLQAPAPYRSAVNGTQTRTGSPESTTDQKPEVNGVNGHGTAEPPRAPTTAVTTTAAPQKQVPISFAAITASAPPDAAAEVSVTA
ncbi:hypothetical protein K435DRAFT_815404 [Dendrothele bispora CBS 962.96]|uniref:C3H1-type domain-containing protein n=1 Tax=Dendrothele bispora (strain CBS 962.96) TaxID=1314807 RepID=A0A4S8MY31_DENBC|nr:hypothetical protein K435DRAFT_815404 [Dendrothele bispora CBS 962.96]